MTIKAHFDGKVLVPEEPGTIPVGKPVTVHLPEMPRSGKTAADLLALIESDPEIAATWKRIAAGRDSVEVARDLRPARRTSRDVNDPYRL